MNSKIVDNFSLTCFLTKKPANPEITNAKLKNKVAKFRQKKLFPPRGKEKNYQTQLYFRDSK